MTRAAKHVLAVLFFLGSVVHFRRESRVAKTFTKISSVVEKEDKYLYHQHQQEQQLRLADNPGNATPLSEQDNNHSMAIPLDATSPVSDQRVTNTSHPRAPHPKAAVQPRAFEPWPADLPLPCFPPDNLTLAPGGPLETPTKTGFLYLKTYKTASSTTAGIQLRLARNVAQRTNGTAMCQARFNHATRRQEHGQLFAHRIRDKSFLWAVLREPTQRAISEFFHFEVSRKAVTPTDDNFQRFVSRRANWNYYLRSLTLTSPKDLNYRYHDVLHDILQQYDFIGITERMEESAVALAMILGIPLSDVMYLSAKSSGGHDAQTDCTLIQSSFVSPGMQAYFASPAWEQQIGRDALLYQAVNQSLDLTIDRLGRAAFDANLATFRQAQTIGQERCESVAVFPCGKNGEQQHFAALKSCLWKDSGCGYACLDEVAADLGIDKLS